VENEQTTAEADSDRRGGDRRATLELGGRREAPRRAADRAKVLRDMAALVFALCGGLAVVYLFFAALGAIDIGEAATASLIALGLGVVWMLGYGVRLRNQAFRATRADKDRRGF
jgi:hypothetical protein